MSQTSENLLPAATGQTLGNSGQRWDALLQNVNVSGTAGIYVLQSGVGAVARTVGAKAQDIFSIEDFAPTGDGVANDTTALTNALTAIATAGVLAAKLRVPRQYLVNSGIAIPANVTLVGEGMSRSKLIKATNGDLLTLADGAGLRDLWVDCGNTQGKTGRGVLISTGYLQKIQDCRIDNCESYCVEYTAALAGTYSRIENCLIGNRNSPYVAIKLADDGGISDAAPKYISRCNAGGAILCDFNGACQVFFDGNYNAGVTWTGGANTSFNVQISNCRLGVTSALTISGVQTQVVNCIIGNAVIFDSNSLRCQYANSQSDGTVTDNGTSNNIFIAGQSYTPTWTQASGTQPALGNGTLVGFFSRQGSEITVRMRWVSGTTTTYGNSAVSYLFSLPKAASATTPALQQGFAIITDLSATSAHDIYKVQIAAGETTFAIFAKTGGALVKLDTPITFATGDIIEIFAVYSCG